MLNAIQRFFAYHMIETYGCDYSTSGLSFDTLHSKLKAFLELRTVDGPRHDTLLSPFFLLSPPRHPCLAYFKQNNVHVQNS